MSISRRTILQTAAVLALARGATAANSIKIGIPVALTGPLGGIGTQMRRACDFWAKQVNAKGGLLGRPVELIVEDTAANPATAVRVVQEMVERSGVRLITCIVASNEALAVVPKLAEWDTIFISGDNGDGRLTGKSLVPNFFRPNTSGPMGTRAVALWLRNSPMKTFYGIGMDYAWGHNSMEVFEIGGEAGGQDLRWRGVLADRHEGFFHLHHQNPPVGRRRLLPGSGRRRQHRIHDPGKAVSPGRQGAAADRAGG